MTTTTDTRREATAHEHEHARNRFAVIPTHERLGADTRLTGRGVTVAFLDSGFYPHPDLVERVVVFKDIGGEETSLDPERVPESWHWHGTIVTVAFLDSGFYPRPDLVERVVVFKDIGGEETSLDPERVPESWHWHGTMVAVAAAGNGRLCEGVYRGLAHESDVALVKARAGGRS